MTEGDGTPPGGARESPPATYGFADLMRDRRWRDALERAGFRVVWRPQDSDEPAAPS